jgi:hypothetical protein
MLPASSPSSPPSFFPFFAQAREKARQATCQSNLKGGIYPYVKQRGDGGASNVFACADSIPHKSGDNPAFKK